MSANQTDINPAADADAAPTPSANAEQDPLEVRIADDHMKVFVTCTVTADGFGPLLDEVQERLVALRVEPTPTREEVAVRLAEAVQKAGPKLNEVTLLEGKAPAPPVDAQIDWPRDFFASGFVVDEKTGEMDYWRPAAQLDVAAGEHLARLRLPQDGTEGRNVLGKPIPPARPKTARLTAGRGVRREQGDGEERFCAEHAGRIRWVSDTLSVDQVYQIKGDVGLKTGHVKHSGAVIVKGDILEGSRVTATGDVEVSGMIEAADIEAGGSLVVKGGISGKLHEPLHVAGAVTAKFIVDAEIEAGGDVQAVTEIVQSTVKTQGAVSIPSGRIVGGEIVALNGITAGQAGSGGGVQTLLTSAVDYVLSRRLQGQEGKALEMLAEFRRIRKTVAPFKDKLEDLQSSQRVALMKLNVRATELKQAIAKLGIAADELDALAQGMGRPFIEIEKVLHSDTRLCIRGEKLVARETRKGPLRVALIRGAMQLTQIQAEKGD